MHNTQLSLRVFPINLMGPAPLVLWDLAISKLIPPEKNKAICTCSRTSEQNKELSLIDVSIVCLVMPKEASPPLTFNLIPYKFHNYTPDH